MFHRLAIFSLSCLLSVALVSAQEKVFEIPIENSNKEFSSHYVKDRTLNQSYLLRVAYDEVDVFVLNDSMKVQFNKTFKIGIKQEKFYLNELLGFTAVDGVIYGYYTNYNITIPGYLLFNMRARGVRRGQLPFDLDKRDEYLFHFIKDGVFYMASATRKSSVLKLYKILTPKNIKRYLYRVDEYRDLHDMFKVFSDPKPMDVGVIYDDIPTDLSLASKKIKAYVREETLDITFESNLGTELISLDMDSAIYTEKVIPYVKLKNKGYTNNSNSFIQNGLQFVARSSGKEVFLYVKKVDDAKILFENRFTSEMKEIPFTNELPSGETIFTSSSFYRNTPRDFLRVLANRNVGIVATDMGDHYLITLGSYEELKQPLTNPYTSKLSGRQPGRSSYIQTKLSKDFEWMDDTIKTLEENSFDDWFKEKDIKGRYVYAFEHEGDKYVSFLDRKKKTYNLYVY